MILEKSLKKLLINQSISTKIETGIKKQRAVFKAFIRVVSFIFQPALLSEERKGQKNEATHEPIIPIIIILKKFSFIQSIIKIFLHILIKKYLYYITYLNPW